MSDAPSPQGLPPDQPDAIARKTVADSGRASPGLSTGPSAPQPTIDDHGPRTLGAGDGRKVIDARFAAPPDEMLVPGYAIVGELGRGAMGVVYKARQLALNRWVALKMVLAGAHAGEVQLTRFRTEAEAVAGLQHPNIVQIYEIGSHDGLPYLSLEFVDGGSLSDKVHRQPQPPREAAHLVETLARAMAYAHERGIIHRDLKPANVLLTANAIPKITDFGLAKRLEQDSSQTKSGSLIGTPNYMAPEQARGETRNIGPAADIYALGALLYELLTGRPPFQAPSTAETLVLVTRDDPAPPSRLQRGIARDLEVICLKCLRKEPVDRYASAQQLAEDLKRWLTGEPILARPISRPERFWRWCKRNPGLAAAAAAVFLLLLVVSIGSTWAALAIRKERNLAVQAREEAVRNETIANEQADLALQTLNMLTTKVQRRLYRQAGLQDLKRDLLQTAMAGLRRVADQISLQGRKQRNISDAYLQMGILATESGDSEQAYAYFERCRDLMRAGLEHEPHNDRWKTRLAEAYLNLGELSVQARRDMKKALECYEEALKLRKEIIATPDEERERENKKLPPELWLVPFLLKLNLSEAYTRVGLTHYFMGDSEKAEAPILESLAIRQRLVTEVLGGEAAWTLSATPMTMGNPLAVVTSTPWMITLASEQRQHLARNYHLLAEIYYHSRNLEKSRDYYGRCVGIREAALKQDPQDFRLRADLAQFYGYYGNMQMGLGSPQDALALFDRSIDLHRAVIAQDKNVQYQRNLAIALYNRGLAALRTKDPAGADKYFRECLQIRTELADKDPTNDVKKMDLMLVLPHCGQHERAAALAEKLRAGKDKDREVLLNIGRCYTHCAAAVNNDTALRGEYEKKALAALTAAVDNGYKDVFALEHDPDLEALRTRPEFRQLTVKIKPS
jgi:serine/threonine-protein kinase